MLLCVFGAPVVNLGGTIGPDDGPVIGFVLFVEFLTPVVPAVPLSVILLVTYLVTSAAELILVPVTVVVPFTPPVPAVGAKSLATRLASETKSLLAGVSRAVGR